MKRFLLFVIYSISFVDLMAGQPPPPPSNPGTVPVDDFIWMLVIMGCFSGFIFSLLITRFSTKKSQSL